MSLNKYGVLKGFAIERRLAKGSGNLHFQVRLVDEATDYRIAINVKSQVAPSELKYIIIDDFKHHITGNLNELALGFTRLQSKPGGIALDFIRGNLFDTEQMKVLPYNLPGPDNDLNEVLDKYVQKAIAEPDSLVYAFGESWGPEDKKDKYFGFMPGNGIHDIHMNQGNVKQFENTDGVWQDGGVIFHYPSDNKYSAVFLAFQSQSFHTDDVTGHTITHVETETNYETLVYVAGAMVNPAGDDVGKETVTLVNVSPNTVNLEGWAIADKDKKKEIITNITLQPGEFHTIRLTGKSAQLSNKGGIISLLDKSGFKVHGVSYTQEEVKNQGYTILFKGN